MFWEKFFQKKEESRPQSDQMIEDEADDTDELYETAELPAPKVEDSGFKIVYEKVVVHTERSIDSER